jgi:hypothetical protein
LIRIPDRQFVVVVTISTRPRSVPATRMPFARKRCTIPGPRMPTSVWAFVEMPCSFPVTLPLHAVVGSACPVIVKPLSRNSIRELPKTIQGAPLTAQVTSPTSRLSLRIVRVAVIRPLISSALAAPAVSVSAAASKRPDRVMRLVMSMSYSFLRRSHEDSAAKDRQYNTQGQT